MQFDTQALFASASLRPSPFQFAPLTFAPMAGIPMPLERNDMQLEDTQQYTNKKRKRTAGEILNTPALPTESNAEQIDNGIAFDQKRRKAPERKKEMFRAWLRLRQKGRMNPKIEEEVRTLNPEDLYGHFLDFLPEDLEAFDEQLRFERVCAEDALGKAESYSWLLRRSSYNRHWRGRLVGAPEQKRPEDEEEEEEEPDFANESSDDEKDEVDLDPDAQLKPTFFAFSYKRDSSLLAPGEKEIGHLLIVYTPLHGWALAEEDRRKQLKGGGTKIFCRHFFPSFIGLLANALERVGVNPTQMISYEVKRNQLELELDD